MYITYNQYASILGETGSGGIPSVPLLLKHGVHASDDGNTFNDVYVRFDHVLAGHPIQADELDQYWPLLHVTKLHRFVTLLRTYPDWHEHELLLFCLLAPWVEENAGHDVHALLIDNDDL